VVFWSLIVQAAKLKTDLQAPYLPWPEVTPDSVKNKKKHALFLSIIGFKISITSRMFCFTSTTKETYA
jgi:hypothetical protein